MRGHRPRLQLIRHYLDRLLKHGGCGIKKRREAALPETSVPDEPPRLRRGVPSREGCVSPFKSAFKNQGLSLRAAFVWRIVDVMNISWEA